MFQTSVNLTSPDFSFWGYTKTAVCGNTGFYSAKPLKHKIIVPTDTITLRIYLLSQYCDMIPKSNITGIREMPQRHPLLDNVKQWSPVATYVRNPRQRQRDIMVEELWGQLSSNQSTTKRCTECPRHERRVFVTRTRS
jgi:hypothetical protein